MPMYEYKCLDCGKEFLVALSLKEHESGAAKCSSCGSKKVEQEFTSFVAKTASKA
ncbi:MAG TPA: zinc ribbon domain-containing protein [Nitrospirales bacterium]|nr:zinc ribbon domain-containing protein [Nitrospirales bacterium]